MSEPRAAQQLDPGPTRDRSRWWWLPAVLWPLLLLWPCLFGGRTFLPYDLAQHPPASLLRTPAELAAMRAESNYDITETPVWFVPELQRARHTLLEEGALPNWHPTARTGTALLPHGHDAILYPPLWPALLAPDPARWLGFVALLDLAIAGLLMFGFLRALRLDPAAAAFGALALAASSTLCANAHNYSRLASLVWLPGMLWALRAATDRQGPARNRCLCGLAAAFALLWFGGFPPYAVPASLLAGVYALHLAGAELRRDRRAGLRLLLAFAAAFALGAALAAVYLLPAFGFFGASARSLAPDLERLSLTTFDPFGLLGYLAPDLFGRPDLVGELPYDRSPLTLLLSHRDTFSGRPLTPAFNATEYAVFGGSLVLWLALAGLGDRAARHRWFPLLALLLLWTLATFLLPFCYLFLLPGVRVAPPLRYLGPCCVLLAWLGAQGLDAALRGTARRRLGVALALALLTSLGAFVFAGCMQDAQTLRQWGLAEHLAARYAPLTPDPAAFTAEVVDRTILRTANGGDYVARGSALAAASAGRAAWFHAAAAGLLLLLAWQSARRSAAWPRAVALGGVLLLTGGELLLAAGSFDRGIARAHSDWTVVHDFLVEQRRATSATGGFMIARAAAPLPDGTLPAPAALPPGPLGPHGVRDLQVYSFFDARSAEPLQALLTSLGYAQFRAAEGYVASSLPDDARVLAHPLLDLLSVRYVLASAPLQHAGQRTGPQQALGPGGEFYVYQRPSALPRAFVVDSLSLRDDDDQVLAELIDPKFRPREHAFALRRDLEAHVADRGAPGAAARAVQFVRDHANSLELAVAAGPPGWLLLTDTWMPGWSATVDGEARDIVRADHCFRAVPLPAGACTVAFHYTAPGQRAGWLLSAGALLLLLAIGWCSRTSRPATSPVDIPT